MFEEEGSHYWILAILFLGIIVIVSGLYLTGILKLNAIPGPPKGIQITQIENAIKITWDKSISTDVVGYNVYRSKQYSVKGEKINSELINTTEYLDKSLLEDGTYFYMIKATDMLQEDESTEQFSYYFDTMPPYDNIISINDGAKYTGTADVKLYLKSSDSYKCRYKNENDFWSTYSNYALVKDWEIVDAEGVQIVYYQCQDKNYNEGPVVIDSIILDKTKPEINFKKSIEAYCVENENIEFSLESKDNYPNNLTCSVYFDNNLINNKTLSFLEDPVLFEFIIEKQNIGNYTINIVCEDASGNKNEELKNIKIVSFGEYKSEYINISINNGNEETEDREVELYLTSSKADLCKFRNEQRIWSELEKYKTNVDWVLSSGTGIKTVYVECFDIYNKSIGINWDSIEYIKTNNGGGTGINCNNPPTNLNIKINGGEDFTNSLDVNLILSAVCADKCRYKNEGDVIWPKWTDYRTSKSWDLSKGSETGEGTHEIFYQCKNEYGESGIVSDSIVYDVTPPNGEANLIGEAKKDGKIELNWDILGIRERNLNFNIYKKRDFVDRNFNLVDTTDEDVWVDYDTVNEQEYQYYITLVDEAKNEGTEESNIISIVADSESPEIEITSPREGKSFDKTQIDLGFYVEDNLADIIICEYQAGGRKKDLGEFSSEQSNNKIITLSTSSSMYEGEEEISIYLFCEDEVGNEESTYINIIYVHTGDGSVEEEGEQRNFD